MNGDHKRGVALLGRAGTGKSAVAFALVKAGVCEHQSGFADALKADLRKLGIEKGQPYARDAMIAYGQNRRSVSPNHWVDCLRHELHDDLDGEVVDDVRFPNEVAFLRDRGFLIVRLRADAATRISRGITREFAGTMDQSETATDGLPVDLTLNTTTQSVAECVAIIAEAMQPVPA